MSDRDANPQVLVHLASGLGNIVLATALLVALAEMGASSTFVYAPTIRRRWTFSPAEARCGPFGAGTPLCRSNPMAASYPRSLLSIGRVLRASTVTAATLSPTLPTRCLRGTSRRINFECAHALGYPCAHRPAAYLPVSPSPEFGVAATTVVLAAGSKTGEMAVKRWPVFRGACNSSSGRGHRRHSQRCRWARVRSACTQLRRSPLSEGDRQHASQRRAGGGKRQRPRARGGCLWCAHGHVIWAHAGSRARCVSGVCVGLPSGLPCEPCWNSARLKHCDSEITCLSLDRVLAEIEGVLLRGAARPEPCVEETKACPCE